MVAALVIVVLLVGWWWRGRSSGESPHYRTAEVERGMLEATVSATGTIEPVVQVEVGSQVSGTIKTLSADYNSMVHKGDVLCQIDPSSFHARVLQSEAAVAHAEAAVHDGELALRRAQQLLPQQYVAQADVDAAQATLDQRKADLKLARAQLEQAQVDFANTTIRAPIDGVVISRAIDVGQTVAASLQAPKLFVIANNLSEMQVETKIDEADIGRIHPGLPVTFTVDAFPDRTFDGRVAQVRLEPIIDQNVVTYTTVIRTRNPELRLRPGMTANVSVNVATRDSVLKVPNMALRFRPPEAAGARRGPGAGGGMGAGAGTPGGSASAAGGAQAAASMRDGPGARMGGAGGPSAAGSPNGAARAGGGGGAWAGRGGAGGGSGGAWAGRSGAGGAGNTSGAWAGKNGAGAGQRAGRPGARGASGVGADPNAKPGAPLDLDRAMAESANESIGTMKPGKVYLLRDGKPVAVMVMTGLTDGIATEIRSENLQPGDQVITALEQTSRGPALTPPPGMGGPMGPRPGGRGR